MAWWAPGAASANPRWCDWWLSQYSDPFFPTLPCGRRWYRGLAEPLVSQVTWSVVANSTLPGFERTKTYCIHRRCHGNTTGYKSSSSGGSSTPCREDVDLAGGIKGSVTHSEASQVHESLARGVQTVVAGRFLGPLLREEQEVDPCAQQNLRRGRGCRILHFT